MFLDPETVGHVLFGRSLRLTVLLWVLEQDGTPFYQSEAADGVDDAASAVRDELERFVEVGMLTKHERTAGERRQYYSSTDSPLWAAVEATRQALLALEGSSKEESDSANPS